jgi:hypothetical protein
VEARKFDEILKVEAKYRHFDTFSNDPTEDAFVLYAMGCANDACSPNETCCLERASYYYEKAKERIEDADANDQRQKQKAFLKSEIGIYFALLYSKGRDMEKAISFHRWFLVNRSNRHDVSVKISIDLISLSIRLKYWKDPWI